MYFIQIIISVSLLAFGVIGLSNAFSPHREEDYNEYDAYPDPVSLDDSDDEYYVSDLNDKMAALFDIIDLAQPERPTVCANIMCVPKSLCVNDMVVNGGDNNLLDWRMSTKSYEHHDTNIRCNNSELLCCADSLRQQRLPQIIRPIFKKVFTEQIQNMDIDQAFDGSTIGSCGYQFHQKHRMNVRPTHGSAVNVEPMELPWMVDILERLDNGQLQYIGGGSIVHKHIILTAAHFLYHLKPEQLVIRVNNALHARSNNVKYQQRNVTRLIIHDGLYAPGRINDIALLAIEHPLEWSPFVNPICLPPQHLQTPIRSNCMASGWCKDKRFGTIMKRFDVSIVAKKTCQRLLRETRLGPYYRIDASLECAGDFGHNLCKGSGGSPLVCEIPNMNNRFYQCGIMTGSAGSGHMPAMYVNVAHFTNWIKEQMRRLNLYFVGGDVLRSDAFVS